MDFERVNLPLTC